MQQYPNNNPNPFASEEIDFLEVIKNTLKVYKKWKKFLLYCLIIGTLLGGLFFFFTPKTYLTRMYVASNLLKGPSFIILMDDLQKHLKERNYGEVSAYLGLDIETVKKIDKVEVYSAKNFAEKEFNDLITQADNDDEKELNNSEFVIQALISDNLVAKQLEKGIIYYLENNTFSKMKSKQRKDGLRAVRTRLRSELSELDSLRYSLNDMYTNKGKFGESSIIMSDPSAIYNNILNLFRTEITTNDDINTPDIIIVQGFTTFKKQHSPKLSICLMVGFFGSLVFSIFYIVYSELKRKLKEIEIA